MLFISSRRELSNEDVIGDDEFWDIEISAGMETGRTRLGGFNEVTNRLKNRRVLILVHGYNNEFEDIIRAYGLVEEKVMNLVGGEYDDVVGYTWPGGDNRFEYFSAKTRAGAIAPRFCHNLTELLADVQNRPASVDVMTHSMGARVSLEALKHIRGTRIVRTLFLLASAVDNESLELNEEYFDANSKVEHSIVFHSRHDQVLSLAYRFAEFDRALGQNGPEDPASIIEHSPRTWVVNCKNHIRGHGDYKGEDEVYRFIAQFRPNSTRQFTTL